MAHVRREARPRVLLRLGRDPQEDRAALRPLPRVGPAELEAAPSVRVPSTRQTRREEPVAEAKLTCRAAF